MENEDQICKRYEAEFAAIAALDRLYYLIPSATIDERREYAARQARLEEMRSRFYSEIATRREGTVRPFRRCRIFVRRIRRSFPHY